MLSLYKNKHNKFNKKKIIILSKEFFIIFFFCFNYFILNHTFNKLGLFSNNVNLLILKYDCYYYNYYYYIFLLKKYNNNIFLNNYYILNLYLFIYLEFLKRKKVFLNYSIYFLKRKKNLKLYFFNDINFRFDLIILFRNWEYIYYYKIIKYNEYLNQHVDLIKYPFLKKFLNYYIIKNFNKKTHLMFFSKKLFLNKTQFYLFNKVIIKKKCLTDLIEIDKILNFCNIIKLFVLFNKLNNKFILFCLKSFNLVYFFYFIYNIWLYYFEEIDWVEIKKFKIDNFFMLFWKLNRYGFKIKEWLTLYLIKVNHSFILNLNVLNIFNLKYLTVFEKKSYIKKYSNIFLYKIINLLLLEYIYSLFYKFLGNWEKNRINKFVKRWVKNWIILKRACVFDWLNIEKYTITQIFKNINFLTYSFLFIGDLNYKYKLTINLVNIQNKLILDSFFFNKNIYFYNIINVFNSNIKIYKNNYIFLIFIYFFLKELNIKILFNFYIFNNKDNYQKNMSIIKNIQLKLVYYKYYNFNKSLFIPSYLKSIYLYIYWFLAIIYINKNKNCCLFKKKKLYIIYGYLNW